MRSFHARDEHTDTQRTEDHPAQVTVVKHVQHIYSCRHCEEHAIKTPIKKAEMPNPVIPKGLASPSAIAHVMMQKFADELPLYRQEIQLERMGIPLNRQTLSNWMLSSTTRWLKPFYDELYRRLREEEVLHADETVLQVLGEPGKKRNQNPICGFTGQVEILRHQSCSLITKQVVPKRIRKIF